MEQEPNPFDTITVVQYVGQYHVPREITLRQMYNKGWWITFVNSNNICLVRKNTVKKNHISFSCKFLKIHRGTIDNKALRQIERFSNKQWKKYGKILIGDNYETDNQI